MSYERDANATRVLAVAGDGTTRAVGAKVAAGTGAAGAAVAQTLAAVSGKRHRIHFLHIIGYATAARTGGATPTAPTITGLDNGTVTFSFPTAQAIGTMGELKMEGMFPLEGLVNTAVVVTCPATANVIWTVIVGYTTSI